MASCPRIRKLSLSSTAITDRTVAQLARLSNLDELDLSRTSVSDKNLHELLSGCGRLRKLNLDQTRVTNDCIEVLAEAKHLRILDLADTEITEDGMASLKLLSQLSSLTVWGHEIDPETERAIKASLPNTIVTVGPVRH